MSIESHQDLLGIRKVSEAAGATLKKMRDFAKPGLTTKALDEFGCTIIQAFGAKSAPKISYGFPGWTCISLNHEIAHGIPSDKRGAKNWRSYQYRRLAGIKWLFR